MKLGRLSVFILCLTISFYTCKKDDDTEIILTEVRDRDEVQEEDINTIEAYLASHYYNSNFINSLDDISSADIVITKLEKNENGEEEDVPDGHTKLIDLLGEASDDAPVLVKGTTEYASTTYEYYFLKLNKGGSDTSPSFADEVRVSYQGFLLDDDVTIFDSAVSPVLFDLTTLIPGWRKVLPFFKTAKSFNDDGGDGVIDFEDHGVGVMFLPSGLAYFSGGTTGISSYTPIAFKFDLMQSFETDHDGDGIPSYMEDVNNDGEYTIANPDDDTISHDDTDGDGVPNAFDADDDGDGVSTANEDIDGDGDPTNDIGKNNIAKYLDPEETESN